MNALPDSFDNPQTEIAALRQRIADLEAQLAQFQPVAGIVSSAAPIIVYAFDNNGIFTLSEGKGLSLLGLEPGQVVGHSLFEFYKHNETVVNAHQSALKGRAVNYADYVNDIAFESWVSPLYTDGQIIGGFGLALDVTERMTSERRKAELAHEVINAQQAVLRELSTPIIPISDGVLIMPLIGAVDAQRAQTMLETLLTGIHEHQAELVILDVTGMQDIDTQIANVFIQTAQATRLLGAQVMMTGVQPLIARTMIQLGIDLSNITTHSTLQAGVAAALNR